MGIESWLYCHFFMNLKSNVKSFNWWYNLNTWFININAWINRLRWKKRMAQRLIYSENISKNHSFVPHFMYLFLWVLDLCWYLRYLCFAPWYSKPDLMYIYWTSFISVGRGSPFYLIPLNIWCIFLYLLYNKLITFQP